MTFTLEMLEGIIADRAKAAPENSWTAKLLSGGAARVAKKFGEEAVEAAIAAAQGDQAELTKESADVLYHLLVLLKSLDVPLSDVLSRTRTAHGSVGDRGEKQPGWALIKRCRRSFTEL